MLHCQKKDTYVCGSSVKEKREGIKALPDTQEQPGLTYVK
jgi:hypothetical protein